MRDISAMFRFISKKSDGTVISFVFGTAHEAYKHCISYDETFWHRMLYPPVLELLNAGQALVLVSHDEKDANNPSQVFTANYIQALPEGHKTPFPELPMPPIKH